MSEQRLPFEFPGADPEKINVNEWKLDGLPQLSDAASKYASFVQTLLLSPQWQTTVAASFETLNDFGKEILKQRAQALKAQQDEFAKTNKSKTEGVQAGIAALQEEATRMAAPVTAPANPDLYAVSVRVNLEDKQMGVPGLLVRMTDPKNKKQSLAEGTTDVNGNALLQLEKQQVDRLGESGQDVGIEVLSPSGKTAYRQQEALSPKLNHSDILIASVKSSSDLKQNVAAATQMKATRDARITSLQQDLAGLQSELADQKMSVQGRLDVTANLLKVFSKTGRQKEK